MSASDLPKNQHYVPQFLLKKFSGTNSDHIWAFDKSNGNIFGAHVSGLAAENGFYNLTHETSLLSLEPFIGDFETLSAVVIEEILDRESITEISPKKKKILADFVAIQFVRTKNARENRAHFYQSFKTAMLKKGVSEEVLKNSGYRDLTPEEVKAETLNDILNYEIFSPHFESKDLVLHKSDRGGLYISDNPICLENLEPPNPVFSGLGIAVPGIQIFLPISDKFLLGFYCPTILKKIEAGLARAKSMRNRGTFNLDISEIETFHKLMKSGAPMDLSEGNVIRYNSLQVANAERFVYSASSEFSLAKIILQEEPNLNKGPRGGVQ